MALDPLAYIRQYESGGGTDPAGANIYNYLYKTNPSYYSASGFYQIVNSTWRGIPTSITQGYTTAISAPFNVQTDAASYLYNRGGFSDWAPYNKNLTAAINAAGGTSAFPTPGSYTPTYDTGNTGTSDNSYTTFSPDQPLTDGSTNFDSSSPTDLHLSPDLQVYTGGPDTLQLSPDLQPYVTGGGVNNDNSQTPYSSIPGNVTGQGGLAGLPGSAGMTQQQASQWWNTAVTIGGDYLTRFGIVLIALILIAAAVFALSGGEKYVPFLRGLKTARGT